LSKLYPIEIVHEDVVAPVRAKQANFRRKSNVLSVAICAVVLPGLLATIALPAYGAAMLPSKADVAAEVRQSDTSTDAQELDVAASAQATNILTRENFGVIAPVVVAPASTGTSLRAVLANPPYPRFDLAAVPGVAARYLGVPYQFGGESPAGFDCSGLVAYVYAQFGISLPHSAAAQGRIGTTIARAAALPGDVVVMDGGSHVGIYLGGGRMLDAPEAGRVVTERAIYDNNYYIVRFGI
jgi:cell wall-associated NlpC family hydrolase